MIPFAQPEELDREISSSERVLVWFTSPGCAPCRKLEPAMQLLYYRWKRKVKFLRLSVEDYPEEAEKYKITSVPTLILFSKGREIGRLDGIIKKEQIEELLRRSH